MNKALLISFLALISLTGCNKVTTVEEAIVQNKNISISLPTQWQIADNNDFKELKGFEHVLGVYKINEDNNPLNQFIISVEANKFDLTTQKYIENTRNLMLKSSPNLNFSKEVKTVLNGVPGILLGHSRPGPQGINIKVNQIILLNNDIFYIITYTGQETEFKAWEKKVMKQLETFKTLASYPEGLEKVDPSVLETANQAATKTEVNTVK